LVGCDTTAGRKADQAVEVVTLALGAPNRGRTGDQSLERVLALPTAILIDGHAASVVSWGGLFSLLLV
jgi:hypothetical protein